MALHCDELTSRIIQSHVSLDDKVILEIGCGDGRVTRFLVSSPKLLIAFDPDMSRLNQAKETVPDATYLAASGLALPFANETLDLVFFTLSLHHHPDPAAALSEAQRVVTPNGRIVVMEPVNSGELEQICNIFNDEGPVLEAAQSAIDNSPLQIAGTEIFTTAWHAQNAQELVAWLFEFYARPFDQTLAAQVQEKLGDKVDNTPLYIEDSTLLTCLRNQEADISGH